MKYQSSLFLFLMLTQLLTAQTLSPDINQVVVVPQSPEAGAFEKYGNVPVSMYTGTPNISVPLFNLQGREISIPASLSYDASGIKVDQMATWVGLGWNLNVGGVVTRQVVGLPDGYPDGVLTPDPNSSTVGISSDDRRIYDFFVTDFIDRARGLNLIPTATASLETWYMLRSIERDLPRKEVDLAPDLFSFNVNGLSGTVYINYALGTAYCSNDPNIKVEYIRNPILAPKDQLQSWLITGPDGTQYTFAKREITSHTFDTELFTGNHQYTSAWYLTEILSLSKKDQVIFNYSDESDWVNNQSLTSQLVGKSDPLNTSTYLNLECGQSSSSIFADYSEYKIRQFYLESIDINGKRSAEFHVGTLGRKDLEGRFPLKSITYSPGHALGGDHTSKIAFSQSYFITVNGTFNDTTIVGSSSEDRTRLKLDAVHMLGTEEPNLQRQVYTFDYIEPTKLPKRSSAGADFWGYYNGVLNTDLVPSFTLDDGTVLPGANRNPQINFAKIGTLHKIHYPTGGHTEFNFSLHSTGPTLNKYDEEVPSPLLNLQGGFDPADTYDYHPHDDYLFDILPSAGNPGPKGDDQAFYISSDDLPAKVRFELNGPLGYRKQYIELYKSLTTGPDCPTAPLCPTSTPLTFYELTHPNIPPNPLDRVYFGNPFDGGNYLEVSIYSPGTYRVLALNTDSQSSIQVEVVRTVEMVDTSPVQVGGLKVHKTVDRKDDSGSGEALTKLYYYDDLSQYTGDLSTIDGNSFSGYYPASGLVHTRNIFHDYSTAKDCSLEIQSQPPGQGAYECIRIQRYSSNKFQSIGPHISYSTVSELTYSSVDGINGFTVYDYYNEKETVGDIPFPKRKLANGINKRTRIYDNGLNLLEESLNYYSVRSISGMTSTRGMIIRPTNVSLVGYRYYQQDTPGSDQYYMDYVEECRMDAVSGTGSPIFNLPPYPCLGQLLGLDTIWTNGFYEYQTVNGEEYEIYHTGGSQNCSNGPNSCVQGLDYTPTLIPIYEHPDDADREVICNQGTWPNYEIINYAYSSYWLREDSSKVIRYENSNSLTTKNYNFYDRANDGADCHYLLTKTRTHNSDGNEYESRIYYPDDVDIDLNTYTNPYADYGSLALFTGAEKTAIRLLTCVNLHRIGTPILQESYVNGIRTFLQKNTFTDLGLSNWPGLYNGNIVMPDIVQTSLGDTLELKKVIEYHEYDAIGNPLEISRGQNGSRIAFRWGYNDTYVIDRVDNATKAEVDAAGTGNDLRQDGTLGPQAMVNSYEYEPKFGRVSKITDPNGRATTFSYDGFGRLLQVLDHNGNLRSLTEYNLAPHP